MSDQIVHGKNHFFLISNLIEILAVETQHVIYTMVSKAIRRRPCIRTLIIVSHVIIKELLILEKLCSVFLKIIFLEHELTVFVAGYD